MPQPGTEPATQLWDQTQDQTSDLSLLRDDDQPTGPHQLALLVLFVHLLLSVLYLT